MISSKQISVPTLVRVKPGALDRVALYLSRHGFHKITLLHSQDLQETLARRLLETLPAKGIEAVQVQSVSSASFEHATELFRSLPSNTSAIVGLGGGKALDVAKYVGFLARLPYVAVPTSLSNDGFCSPQCSLTIGGRRRSLPSSMPFGVVIDTEVCLQAPTVLWCSGVGDLVSKLTAVKDWRLAFHAQGVLVDDLAALLSDATVFQFLGRPERDAEGVSLLGTALMLNGIAMELCGSSRPASGSEHLISHALDASSQRPRLHGLQVGVATYLVSLLQAEHTSLIGSLFERTGFWQIIRDDPFSRSEWLEAVRRAPGIKTGFYTVLSERDCLPEVEQYLRTDPFLKPCFTD